MKKQWGKSQTKKLITISRSFKLAQEESKDLSHSKFLLSESR